jgi:hypothetical protein
MALLSSNDIKFYLSGGINNLDPNLSLGGARSNQSIVNDQLDNIFDNVNKLESDIGDIEYRCFYVKNNHPTDTMSTMVIYLQDGTDSNNDIVFYGLGTACVGFVEQTIPNESTTPLGGVVFTNAKKRKDGFLIGNLGPGASKSIWLKRVVDEGAGSQKRNKFRLRFEFSPGNTAVPCETGFHRNEAGICVPNSVTCDPGFHVDTLSGVCVPNCLAGFHNEPGTGNCVPNCLAGQHPHPTLPGVCLPNCSAGFHNDPATGNCVQDNPNPPPVVTDFTLAATGDQSTSSQAKGVMSKIVSRNVDYFLMLGDTAYGGISGYFTMLKPLEDAHKIKSICIGNHDCGEESDGVSSASIASHYGLPKTYGSFKIKNAIIIFLNNSKDGTQSNQTTSGEGYTFCKQALEAASADPTILWKIVIFHKPMYATPSSHHTAESTFRATYGPLFDKHGVDIMLCGHNHAYQRLLPIKFNTSSPGSPILVTQEKNTYVNLVNPIHITAGMGGRSHYKVPNNEWCAFTDEGTYGYFYMQVSDGGRKLTGRFYSDSDSLKDEFTITKTLLPADPTYAKNIVVSEDGLSNEVLPVADCAPPPSGPPGPPPCQAPTPQTMTLIFATLAGFDTSAQVEPYGSFCDTIGHEICEAITDPMVNIKIGGVNQTAWISTDKNDEVSDRCQANHRFGTIPNDLVMQGYWSNSDGACLIPPFTTTGPGVNNLFVNPRNSRVLRNCKVYVIFWGSNWATRTTGSTMAGLTEKIQVKMMSTYVTHFDKLAQYGGTNPINRPTWGGVTSNIITPVPAGTIQGTDIQRVITDSINNCLLPMPVPGNENLYMVMCPIGKPIALSLNGIVSTPAGYHGSFTATLGGSNPPPIGGTGNDKFGIKMIYPTKGGGDEFFINDSEDDKDKGRLDWNGVSHTRLGTGTTSAAINPVTRTIYYSMISTQPPFILNDITVAIAHEIIETQTSSDPSGTFDNTGWKNYAIDPNFELADECTTQLSYPTGLTVKGYWSNSDNGCVTPHISETDNGNSTKFTTLSGRILKTPKIWLIFWGSDWKSRSGTPTADEIVTMVKDNLLNVNKEYFAKLGQYGAGTPVWGGAVYNTSTPIPSGNVIDEVQGQKAITDSFNSGLMSIPVDSDENIYVLLVPIGRNISLIDGSSGNGFHDVYRPSLTAPSGPAPEPTQIQPTETVSYTYSYKFGSQGSGNGQFLNPHDVSFDAAGNCFVCDRDRNDIQKFTHEGVYISKFGGSGSGNGQFNVPYALQHTPDFQFIYVCDRDNNRVQKLDASGNYVSQITSVNGKNLNAPEDIIFEPNGTMYICDTGNERVVKLTSAHAFILEWGSFGSGNGQFNHPHSSDVGLDGNIYISSGNQGYIQVFSPTGTFLRKFSSPGKNDGQLLVFLEHLDIDTSGRLHIVNNNKRPIVSVFDCATGNFITKYGFETEGSANGQFREAEHVTVDSSGRPFVVDSSNFRIQVFNVNTASSPPPSPPPGSPPPSPPPSTPPSPPPPPSAPAGFHCTKDTPRVLIFTKDNRLSESDRDPNGGKMVGGFNYANLKQLGHWFQDRDWKNIECTVHLNIHDNGGSDGCGFSVRSVRHSGSGSAKPGSIRCGGSAYHGNIRFADGTSQFKKEQWHVDYDTLSPSSKGIGSIMDKWVGQKFIVYNTSNGDVVLEAWFDKNADNNWELIQTFRDDGTNWGSSMKNCGSATNTEKISWGSPEIICFKMNNVMDWDFRYLSVREISPPS